MKWNMEYPLNLWDTEEDLFMGYDLFQSLYRLNQDMKLNSELEDRQQKILCSLSINYGNIRLSFLLDLN